MIRCCGKLMKNMTMNLRFVRFPGRFRLFFVFFNVPYYFSPTNNYKVSCPTTLCNSANCKNKSCFFQKTVLPFRVTFNEYNVLKLEMWQLIHYPSLKIAYFTHKLSIFLRSLYFIVIEKRQK